MKNLLVTLLVALPFIGIAQRSTTDSTNTSAIALPPASASEVEAPGNGLSQQEFKYRSITDMRTGLDGLLAGVQFTNGKPWLRLPTRPQHNDGTAVGNIE